MHDIYIMGGVYIFMYGNAINLLFVLYRYKLFLCLYMNGEDFPKYDKSFIFERQGTLEHNPGGIICDTAIVCFVLLVLSFTWVVSVPIFVPFFIARFVRKYNLYAKKIVMNNCNCDDK